MASRWRAGSLCLVSFAIAGCGLLPMPSVQSARPSLLDIHVDNGTTRDISIMVNGVGTAVVGAKQSETISAATLPPGNWSIDARLPGGRNVLSFVVITADITATEDPTGAGSIVGAGQRVDLSCGRLDVWVAVAPLGPPPGPGTPGDCDG
jgi:hypothetical protein